MTSTWDPHAPGETAGVQATERWLRLARIATPGGDQQRCADTAASLTRIIDAATLAVAEGHDGPDPILVRSAGSRWLNHTRQAVADAWSTGNGRQARELTPLAGELHQALDRYLAAVEQSEHGVYPGEYAGVEVLTGGSERHPGVERRSG